MKTRFTPHLIDLTIDAALKSFWRKAALSRFLQNAEIKALPPWTPDESKRDYLARVFAILAKSDDGKAKVVELANFLAEQEAFPDLDGWEDTAEKLNAARRSVSALKKHLQQQDEEIASEREKQDSRKRLRDHQTKVRAAQESLSSLSEKLTQLSRDLGKPEAGHAFEKWFYSLMQYCEITARPRYITEGREIDGSVTIGDTTYLVECKFTAQQSDAPDIDIFRAKVESKADNTMGIFVSI